METPATYSATVRYPAEDRVSPQGRAYSTVAVHVQGVDGLVKLFGPPHHSVFAALQVGQQVAVRYDEKGRPHLVDPAAAVPASAPPAQRQQQHAAPAAAPAQPAADPLQLADMWAAAYNRLIAHGVAPEQAGPGASTILIQCHGRR
jgi:hypothetical protein